MNRRLSLTAAVLLIPGLILLVGIAVTSLLAPGAAAEVATHWNATGAADGYASPTLVIAQVGGVGGAVAILFAAILLAGRHDPWSATWMRKFLVAVSAGVTAFVSGLGVWMLATQRAGEPPADLWPGSLVAPGVALVVGVATWFLLPPTVPRGPVDPRPATAVPLAATERAVWIGTARVSRPVILILGVASLTLIGGVAWVVLSTEPDAWPVLVIPVVVGLLLLGLSSYSVRVDESGLRVRAVLGLPVWTIPADRIELAGVVDVDPLGDFGGWGIRFRRAGRTGIVTRSGEALQVRRRGGRALIVTVDDASTAAALLSAVAERAAPRG